MNDDSKRMDELERQTIEVIEELQRQYALAAKPYLEILTKIRAMRPMPPIIVDAANFSHLIDECKRKS